MHACRLGLGLVSALIGSFALATPALGAAGPSGPTGNLLVLLEPGVAMPARLGAVEQLVARTGARRAGRSVPEVGLLTVAPPLGVSLSPLARVLRALPGVASVQVERRFTPRFVPNDPALTQLDASTGVVQWALAREGFHRAWDISHGDGALVGVIDSGADASHPELAAKIAAAVDQQDPSVARGSATTDEVGHGTHVSSLACAATDNGLGIAGAGFNCDLIVEKSDFSDSSIVASIVDATNRRAQAINMSFGPPNPGSAPPASEAEVRALRYAAAHRVVLVSAAGDSPGSEQGDPANVLQPSGTGPDIGAGLGLDVTAAGFDGTRASFAGSGSEISLAAYGAFRPGSGSGLGLGSPSGLLGAFPASSTDLEALPGSCRCRTPFGADNRYAYLQGTSMAAPQVAAVAAMMRVLNPYASLADVLRLLKRTARRAARAGWSPELGWGILDAGAALDATRRLDRLAPVSHLMAPRLARRRALVLTWSGHDRRHAGLIASGIDHFYVYVRVNGGPPRLLARTRRHRLRFRGRAGNRYVFYTVAVDRASNVEVHPRRSATRIDSLAR